MIAESLIRLMNRFVAALTLSLVAGIAPGIAAADLASSLRFDIAPQSLPSALLKFSEQAGVQVASAGEVIEGKSSAGVVGTFVARSALAKLLSGTQLAYEVIDSNTVAIRAAPGGRAAGSENVMPRDAGARPGVTASAGGGIWSRLHLAQADGQGTESEASGNEDSPSRGKPLQLEEVVVAGSRLARHADEGPAPVTVFDREKIDAMGVSTVADVLNYLPQQSFSFNDGLNANGARNVQLRGLANGTTLILINGRRTVPGAGGVTGGVFDLNIIPLAAVDHVEVLADSASAVYGADAVGGVVNIVLKSSIEKPVVDASYGTADGGAAERRFSFSTGGHSEHAQGSFVVDYFRRDPLFGAARDVSSNADFRRYGGVDRRVLTSNPGNICAASGNLPGLSTPCAAVPAGSTGVGLTPASFAATAGQQNLTSLRQWADLVSEAERYSAMASGTFQLSDSIEAFADLLYTDRTETQPLTYRTVSNGLVSASNPFNPFGVPVRANFLLDGLPLPGNVGHEKDYSETLGLRGRLSSWDWELSVLGAQSSQTYQTYGNIDATRLAAALSASNPSQALNVFQDGPGGSFALLSSLVSDPSTNAAAKTSDQYQVAGFVRGELWHIPGGPIQLVTGGEWRKEALSYVNPTAAVLDGDARRTSSSAYAELQVPVLGRDTGRLVLRDISLTLAGRYDDYSDFGDTFNAQYGLEWRPVSTLHLRASHGDSFRAPGLYLLHSPRVLEAGSNFSNGDPHRNLEPFVADWVYGGSVHLGPETSTSSSMGLVWTPDFVLEPRLNATFWRIEQDQRIVQGSNTLALIANEALFPDRVIRAPRTPQDIAAGLPGKIIFIDTSLMNLGSLETSGVDFGVSGAIDTAVGKFLPSLTATRVQTYKAADYPTVPAVERVGVASTMGSIPRWKAVGSLSWNRRGIGVTSAVRYTSSYADAASNNIRNGMTVESQTLVDFQAALDMQQILGATSGLSQGLRIRLGAMNLFNRRAPFSDLFGYGFDPAQGDIRQRFVYVALSKAF
ncbi:MAG: TonB-dependent receptor [Gammaproteobacteria bacterium]